MKKNLLILFLSAFPFAAQAKDNITDYSIEDTMAVEKVAAAIGDGVKFYFAGQSHPKVVKSLGNYQSNKKTNAFGKSDQAACQWAFASAMKTLKKRALREGGNAIINIKSNYRGNLTESATTFKCGAGTAIAGVTLVGDVVKF